MGKQSTRYTTGTVGPKHDLESGLAFIEYLVGLAVLIFVFIIAADRMDIAGKSRATSSNKVVEETLPCQGILATAAGADGCK